MVLGRRWCWDSGGARKTAVLGRRGAEAGTVSVLGRRGCWDSGDAGKTVVLGRRAGVLGLARY